MTSSSSVRVWYKSVCNVLSAILSPHQPQRAVITRPPNPPEEIYCNKFYVVSGHSDFGTKFQGKRCFRCQRIEHWAQNCRAPWPVTYRPNRSGFAIANAPHDNRPGGTSTDGTIKYKHAWHFCTRNCRFKMSRFFSQPCRIFWSLVTNLILEKFPIFIEIILVRVFLHGDLRAIGRLRVSRGSK